MCVCTIGPLIWGCGLLRCVAPSNQPQRPTPAPLCELQRSVLPEIPNTASHSMQPPSRASSPVYTPLTNIDAVDSLPGAPHFSPAAARQPSSSTAAAAASSLTLPADRDLQGASRAAAGNQPQDLLGPVTADQPLGTLQALRSAQPAAGPTAEQLTALPAAPVIAQQEPERLPAGMQQAPPPVSSLAEAYREAAWTGASAAMPWAGATNTNQGLTTSVLQPEQDLCSFVPVRYSEQSRGPEAPNGKTQQQRLKVAAQQLMSARTPQQQVDSLSVARA